MMADDNDSARTRALFMKPVAQREARGSEASCRAPATGGPAPVSRLWPADDPAGSGDLLKPAEN